MTATKLPPTRPMLIELLHAGAPALAEAGKQDGWVKQASNAG
jgi:hypothetical protein